MAKITRIPFEARRSLSKIGAVLRIKKHGRYLIRVNHSTPTWVRISNLIGRDKNTEHLWWTKQ